MFHQGLLDPSMWIEERVYVCLGVWSYMCTFTQKIVLKKKYKECAVVDAFDSSVVLANNPLWIACFFLKEERVYLGFGCGHTLLSRQFLRNKSRCST